MVNEDKRYYVYEWIRLDTNEPFYIGKGSYNRWYESKRGNNCHFNNIVKSIPVAVNILHDELTEDDAFKYECWYIYEYKDVIGYNLVNITDGGEGVAGSFCTNETRKKLSVKFSEENNPAAHAVILLNNQEVFLTVKDAQKQYKVSGVSTCCRGVTNSSGKDVDGTPLLWEYYDEDKSYTKEYFEYKLKITKENKFRNLSANKKGIVPANSRVIILLNTMEKFDSIAEAKRVYKASSINSCCLGHSKYAGKLKNGDPMIWRYDDGTYYDDEYIQLKIDEAKDSPRCNKNWAKKQKANLPQDKVAS